jgi:hypothetical protein
MLLYTYIACLVWVLPLFGGGGTLCLICFLLLGIYFVYLFVFPYFFC